MHDELCFNVENEKQAKEIRETMENCVELKVPSVVDVALGNNFGEAV